MNTRAHLRQEEMIRQNKLLAQQEAQKSSKRKSSVNKKTEDKLIKVNKKDSRKSSEEKKSSNKSTSNQEKNQKQRKNSVDSASNSQDRTQKKSQESSSQIPSKTSKRNSSPKLSQNKSKQLSETSEDSTTKSTFSANKTIKAKSKISKKTSDSISNSDESSQQKSKFSNRSNRKSKEIISENSDSESKGRTQKNRRKQSSDVSEDSISSTSKQTEYRILKTITSELVNENDDFMLHVNEPLKKKGRPLGSKNKPKEIPTEDNDSHSQSENLPKHKGRPKGSKNKPKEVTTDDNETHSQSEEQVKKIGRPKGAKNKPKQVTTDDNETHSQSEEQVKKIGRPKGAKNKPKEVTTDDNEAHSQSEEPMKKIGRPKGAKNKPKEATTDDNEAHSQSEEQAKKIGRPKGSKNKPKEVTTDDNEAQPQFDGLPRPKGRPKGPKNKPKELASEDNNSMEKSDETPKHKGRPKGSKNKPKLTDQTKGILSSSEGIVKHRGRPKGSKNRPKDEFGRPISIKHKGRPKGSKNKPKGLMERTSRKNSPFNRSARLRHRNFLDTELEPETLSEEESEEEQITQEQESEVESNDEESHKQAMLEIFQTDFPEPIFEGNGQLGVNGYRYYERAIIDDFTCKIGDSVLVLADSVDTTYPAKILQLYENRQKEKYAKVIWYSRRQEFGPEARSFIMNRELVLTEKEDEIPLDSMKKLITIYDSPEPLGKDANKKCQFLTDAFFCNRGYITQRQEFVALSTLNRLLRQTEMVIETVSGETKFDIARARLQLNNVSIVASREKEIKSVEGLITGFIRSDSGGCVYLSGVPGTGKTLVVREVIRRLTQQQLNGDLPDFQFYEINCLRLESPRSIYSKLWGMLNFENVNPTTAQRALNETFSMETSPFYIIVLVDEIDLLLTSQQNELYCLTEWASLPNAKFIIIAVANLMDLESRVKPKIKSRMGRSSVKFFAYKYEQLMEIIKSRVGELDVFDEPAMKLCARSISGNGGDARKALETCKRAIDIHKDPSKLVSLDEMSKAIRQVQSIQAKEILKQVSDHQKIFLTAFLQAIKIGQKSYVQIREINERAKQIAKQLKLSPIPNFQFNLIANQLVTMNVIKGQKDGQLNASSMISLQAFDQELIFLLSKQEELVQFLPKLEVNF